MLANMVKDILNWFKVFLLLFVGFVFAFIVVIGQSWPRMDSTWNSIVILFRAMLGEFEW